MMRGEASKSKTETGDFQNGSTGEARLTEVKIEESGDIKLAQATNKISFEGRFAKLKKSLRRRSVSIL